MKATELRLNNWIEGISNTPEKVEAVYFNMVDTDKHDNMYEHQIKPIPLTEEIFVKVEGINIRDTFYSIDFGENGFIVIKWHKGYERFCFEICTGRHWIIDYVHELQNGFHFLSHGNELTINL